MNTDALIFSQCITVSGEVKCEPVPLEIKNILDQYVRMKPRRIFAKVFEQSIKRAAANPGTLLEILTCFEGSEKRYFEELKRLESGKLM